MKFLQLILLSLVFSFHSVSAQVTVTLPELIVASGVEIKVPVAVSGFYGIGAVSLAIEFNSNALSYIGISELPAGFISNHADGVIYIAFANLLPLNAGNDTLFYIEFKHLKGNSNLKFTDECETANSDGTVLPAEFKNGKITDPDFQTAAVGDRVWMDLNKNGIQDNAEPGLGWVTVELFECGGRWIAYSLTDQDGYYRFPELAEGDYYIKFTLIDGNAKYTFTSHNSGDNDLLDSDAEMMNDSTAKTECISLNGGESLFNFDAGVYLKEGNVPDKYYLSQNYPNPFNPNTSIIFSIPVRENVNITVYNILGERVRVLLNEILEPGMHSAEFNAEGLKSGVYFYRLATPSAFMTGKMVLER